MTAPPVESILSQHPFFQDIAPQHIHEISEHASSIRFDAGRLIFRQGEPANQFYLISTGLVGLEVFAPERGSISLMTLGAGDVLGWSWLIPPYVWHLDARALEPTEAIVLDGAGLRGQCAFNHELGYQLMRHSVQIIEQRFQAALMQVMDLYKK